MRTFFLAMLLGCNSVTAEQACTTQAQDRCTELMKCSPADLEKRWPDLATCESREKHACMNALDAAGTANTPSHEEACGEELGAEECSPFLSAVNPPVDCLPPHGTRANGTSCAYAAQCQSGFCAIASTSLCGTCAAAPGPGDSCANQGCGPTMNCVAATMTCQSPVPDGSPCTRDLPCIQGDACVGATASVMGTCTKQGTTVGAACDSMLVTAPSCDAADGLTCDRSTGQCVMQPLAPAGQTCGLVNNVAVACTAGADCDRPSGATGTCVAPAADGAACDSVAGPSCLFPAKCIPDGAGTAGTCKLAGSIAC